MASAAVTRKKKSILNKLLLYILLLGAFSLSAQQPRDGGKPSYRKFRKDYKYIKKKDYFGPDRNYYPPVSMDEYEYDENEYNNGYDGLKFSPQQIQRSRRNGTGSGGSNGTKPFDPNIRRVPPIDFDPPNIKSPDLDSQRTPLISPMFWKVLLFVLGFILLAWIVYMIVKNYKPRNLAVPGNFSPAEWNPELIPKTELELRLEAAMLRNDYRECVRIYFTFILKELIRLRRIQWKKDLTNIDYLIQLSGKEGYIDFQESVRIYDLVWYGEYAIGREEYEQVLPHLEKNYQSLIAEHG